MKYKFLIALFFLAVFLNQGISQELEKKKTEKEVNSQHEVKFVISHSHITSGINENGNKSWTTVASWGLDYNYWFNRHWAAGLHTDMLLEAFKVEEYGEEHATIERTRPIALVAAATFKPKDHSIFILGMGGEFAKEGNFVLTRIGYEYAWELPKRWELSAGLIYDLKWNAYDTWTFGLGVSKFFGGK